ncbi:MAG: hypothetical protein ACK6CT_03170 [Planctomycetia bacterium]
MPAASLAVVAAGFCLSAAATSPPAAAGDAELDREPSWSIPTPADVETRGRRWLEELAGSVPADVSSRGQAVWSRTAGSAADPLDRIMETAAAMDARVAELGRAVAGRGHLAGPPDWLQDGTLATFARDAVALWAGRELVRRDRFDEALEFLTGLDPTTAVDPAALLFCRAACQHWLLDTAAAVETLDRLLERHGQIPLRYARVAALLRADAAALESGSLDHIARRMWDSTRRLDLGGAGPATRQVQDGVVESLDRLIESLEKEQQQQAGAGAGGGAGGGGRQGGQAAPLDDSRIADGKGRGDVQKREIAVGEAWGSLPPHRREESLQQIGREFPPHYREAIEQYFKRLATGGEEGERARGR